jgi:hypothetical protein
MKSLKGTALIMLIALLLGSGFTNHKKTKQPLYIQIKTILKAKELWVNLTFSNQSKQPIYLNKLDIGMSPRLMNKLFLVKEGGQEIAYTGVMVKRRTPTLEDFVLLEPGKSVKTSIRLDQSYAFKPGQHRYVIQYSHYHGSPKDESILNEFTSNPYSFKFSAVPK